MPAPIVLTPPFPTTANWGSPSSFYSENLNVALHDARSYIDALLILKERNVSWDYAFTKHPKGAWGRYSEYNADEIRYYRREAQRLGMPFRHRELDPFELDSVVLFHEYIREEGRHPIFDRARVEANVVPMLFGMTVEKAIKHLLRVVKLKDGTPPKKVDDLVWGHDISKLFREFTKPDQAVIASHWHSLICESASWKLGGKHRCFNYVNDVNGLRKELISCSDCFAKKLKEIATWTTDRYYFEQGANANRHMYVDYECWLLLKTFLGLVDSNVVPYWHARIFHLKEFVELHKRAQPSVPPIPPASIREHAPDRDNPDWQDCCLFCKEQYARAHMKVTITSTRVDSGEKSSPDRYHLSDDVE